MFMTKHQQTYSKTWTKLFPKSPRRAVPRPQVGPEQVIRFRTGGLGVGVEPCCPLCPQNRCQARVFDLVNSPIYEVVMVALICLNILLLMVESMDQTILMDIVLNWLHFIYILIFLVECVLKLVGLRRHYFKDGWNIIDFIVLLVQIIGRFFRPEAPLMFRDRFRGL